MEIISRVKMPRRFFTLDNWKNNRDKLVLLEKKTIEAIKRENRFGFEDINEIKFFQENKGKEIIIELHKLDKKIKGVLDSLDKFRIGIISEGKLKFYYKSSIFCFYKADNN